MFAKEIEILEDLIENQDNIQSGEINDIIFNLENFNIFDYFRTLDDSNIIEIILTLLERLENNEKEKAKKAIENDNGFYNPELNKSENNIDIFKKIYDLLCYETY